jgi:hypothetical protein
VDQTGGREAVVATRERGGRTLPFVAAREDVAPAVVARRVAPGSAAYADEAARRAALRRAVPAGTDYPSAGGGSGRPAPAQGWTGCRPG